jgi:hypothetical protein
VSLRTLKSDPSVDVLVCSIFVGFGIALAVIKLISVLVVSARVALEYISSIASMLDFLA